MKLPPFSRSLPSAGGLASTGHSGLDRLMDMLRLGDNVVWHIDELDDYREFAQLFHDRALAQGRKLIYVRFGRHAPVLSKVGAGVEQVNLDPEEGFDQFSQAVHELAVAKGEGAFYIFDCLSDLVDAWATEELLANFFQTACPFLFELRTIAYFGLLRRRHTNQAVARIYNTTQVLIELFHSSSTRFIKLDKVWDRYSSEMFFPHQLDGDKLSLAFDRLEPFVDTKLVAQAPPLGPASPWDSIQALLSSAKNPREPDLLKEELDALKGEFSRMLLGRHPIFTQLADRFLGLDALWQLRQRLIGSGRIGGKAAGMLLAREILKDPGEGLSDPTVIEDHDSYYIGSDIFYTFLVQNQLFRLRIECTRGYADGSLSYSDVKKRFLAGSFSPEIVDRLRQMLEYFGTAPIIARSSSLLEDSFGGAFAGKYRSEFCPNQGTLDERLEQLMRALKLVYASSLSPDALSYRKRRNLEGSEELMGVLIQRVAGNQYRNYFFPMLAGVAFSRNLYAWNDRIDPNQGMVRLVFGMGTRAVDRVGGDYPRLIAVSHPHLRPEVGVEAAKYSQHDIDVINLEDNTFQTLSVWDVLEDVPYPGLHLLVSSWDEEHMKDPYTRFLDPDANYVLTFNNLLRQTPLIRVLREALAILERHYQNPVDIEFTASIVGGRLRFNLLQCRPMWTHDRLDDIRLPKNVAPEHVLFRANRVITGGTFEDVRFIIYVDPEAYTAIDYPPDRKTLGRLVGRINSHPDIAPYHYILMGPGRWGSSNTELGVNVSYADIDNTNVLVELSFPDSGHAPEVSYGTHFFQDLVEEQIIFLPVFPERKECQFASKFFREAPNHLEHYLPEYTTLDKYLKLIDLHRLDLQARLVADPQNQEAICYLTDPASGD